jgi:spore germination protein PB
MSWTIHQSITIHSLRVDAVSNSSVLQVGSAGCIRSLSNLYNTGGFTDPAPEPGTPYVDETPEVPLVPLPPPA